MTELAATLVGRAAELGALDDALDGLADGRLETLVVSGEAGIGKTRLIAELLERADRRGLIGLAGRSAELERDVPYWVFVDALDEYIESLTPNALAGLADDEAAEVAQIFSALAARADDRATGYDRARTQRAVRALLECVGGGRRLVLVLDDFHWADTASIDFVGALLRRPAAGVLVVVSVRSRQMPERVVSALERAGREGLVRRLELAPLDREEGLALLGRDDDTAAAWLTESGGNPFYLQQLARAAPPVRAPGAGATPLAGLPVPPMVADALTEELATLGETGRTFLAGAAVAGDPFELGLAAIATGLDEDTAREAVDELLRVELCHATDTPRRFRFRHPIVRRAVYEAAPAGWRIGAHARVAAVLAAAGASPIARAHHVERSAREGDLDAVAVLCSAGEHAAERAPSAAAESYAAALRLLPGSAGPERRAELLLARAVALAHAGCFEDSRSDLIDAIDLAPQDASVLRARLATACARIEQILGGYERAYQRLEHALESMPGPQSPEAVTLLIELALGGSYPTDWDRMRGWAERAVAAARHLGDPPLLAAALAASARADAFAGNVAPALRARDEAARLVERIPDADLVPRVDALAHLAGAELNLDHYVNCVAHAERALAIGRASGEARLFPLLFGTLGLAWRVRGELSAAIEPLDGAIESARLSGTGPVLAWGLFGRSLIALAAGDIERARAFGEESAELTRAGIQTYVAALAGFAYAGALLETGDPGQAVEILVGRSGGSSLPFLPSAQRAMGLELLARCRLAAQDAEGAKRAAEAAATAAESVGLPLALSFARRAKAAVALAAGDAADAAGMAAEAVLGAEEAGAPIEAALARALAGRALAASGGREAGLLELQRAATALDEVGAVRYRDAAEQALRALGHTTYRRPARASRSAEAVAAELTGRELEIGQLVVNRKTNREIADELFVSRKTVETHLRNIFFKLGINSRVELARTLERNDRS